MAQTRPELDAAARKVQADVIAWRRDFHQHPELSRREQRTAAKDFSDYAREVPGVFFFVGATAPGIDPSTAPSNPSPLFTLDESALDLGTRAMLQLALYYLAAAR